MLVGLISRVNRIADYMSAVMFFLMAFAVTTAVFGRYFFKMPLPEAMSIGYFAMLWCAFLQTGKALYYDRHVSMPFLIQRFSYKSRAIAGIFINIVVLITVVPLFWYSSFFAFESIKYGWKSSGALPLPMFLLYGIMALGSFYLGFIALFKIVQHKRDIKIESE